MHLPSLLPTLLALPHLIKAGTVPRHPNAVQHQDEMGNFENLATSEVPPKALWLGDGPPPVDEEAYQRLVCKGGQFLAVMFLTSAQAGPYLTPPQVSSASTWVSFPKQLTDWGYSESQKTNILLGPGQYGIEPLLATIGASFDSRDWFFSIIQHGDPYTTQQLDIQTYVSPNGRVLRKTGAHFHLGSHAASGTLMVSKQFSARHEATYRSPHIPDADLPALIRSSDIVYAFWYLHTYSNLRGLRNIIIWSVTNPTTQQIIRRAIQDAPPDVPGGDPTKNKLKPWPGYYFDAYTRACKALLGSPNGSGVAWMLIQRKEELGRKTVTGCSVFVSEATLMFEPSIVFYIGNAVAVTARSNSTNSE
ncbi:hypothetical protein BU24DRAFT_409984 [Aaosphaeria arxii CBS 175.79]|uniref:Uncharacterized protein n=1 Tax=Aaosphaeria arxii CBS 175.79 TaxID=1450172 RepID=A0A6A5XLW0_9PLEO|nr:uncharacterized protein BU24DRAFT_409984 [Aaosphaeria arxii CBS 175.79]KAF2014225.1 hypothetical protein BU24DRAFT_409984 [Aaosphaeria arxii CBS 175.79]